MRRAALPALLALAAGCPDRSVAAITPEQSGQEEQVIPYSINRDVDILFVIDNSGSMEDEQDALAQSFGTFMSVLSGIEGGLPNVHVGVVSSNVGAGGYPIQQCGGDGDDGLLQATARGACAPPDGLYISDVSDGDTRVKNYGGTLEDTFSCIARLGTAGCGFEQHLESMKRALDGSRPENAGFLRPGAWLAVVVIADEDDCSAANAGLFDGSTSAQVLEELGPTSFRCTEWGVACDGHVLDRVHGSYDECVAREDSPYLHHPRVYADFLKQLKRGEDLVMVAGIVGESTPFEVGDNERGDLALLPSCGGGDGDVGAGAVPPVRFQAFFDEFPARATRASLCSATLADALTLIAEQFRVRLGSRCLSSTMDMTDLFPDDAHPGLQPACSVTEVQRRGRPDQSETVLARCLLVDGAAGLEPHADSPLPCWYVKPDPRCAMSGGSGLALEIAHAVEPPQGTDIIVRCQSR